ncbi:MAG: hypothetical protein AAF456_22740 [Planctomycetota bacterium]
MSINKSGIWFVIAVLFSTPVFGQFNYQRDRGAVQGGVAGAVLGGVIGNQNDETAEGILLGGALGAIAGGILGEDRDRYIENSWQREQYLQQQRAQLQQLQAAQMARAVTIDDAISLSQSGVSANVILNQIQMNGVSDRLTVNDIIYMSRSGVDESIINAMQGARLAGSPATYSQPTVVVTRPVPVAPTVVVTEPPCPYTYPRVRPVVVERVDIIQHGHNLHRRAEHDLWRPSSYGPYRR